jgi:hypothetical protein
MRYHLNKVSGIPYKSTVKRTTFYVSIVSILVRKTLTLKRLEI